MTTALIRFLEGDYLSFHRAIREEDVGGGVEEEVIHHLRREQELENEPQAEAAQKALRAYTYLKRRRPRLTRLIDRLSDRIDLRFVDGTLECSNEVWSDRRIELESHRAKRDQEVLSDIGSIVRWMWV
jgi:hypothetical protein